MTAVQTASGGASDYWKSAMVLVGAIMFCDGVLMRVLLVPSPPTLAALESKSKSEHALEDPLLPPSSSAHDSLPADQGNSDMRGISFMGALRIPGVAAYALSYACLKAVVYAFLFWLPFYLTAQLGLTNSKADSYSMLFDVGQICGGLLGGAITDRLHGFSGLVIVAFMLLASLCVWYFQHLTDLTVLPVLLVVMGALLGGPGNMICGVVSADLGRRCT